MPIDAARWHEVTALFGELLALSDEEQAQRLAGLVDTDLRHEVESLLLANASVGRRFERAPLLPSADAPSALAEATAPSMVGAWRILRRLGEGGMGVVYEALREDAGFSKRAALKMIHTRGATNPAHVQRFEIERRILARLSHRNIATLLDGGVHDDGRPWFALEYVEGETLVEWCTSRALDARARVQLLRQACSAVQYAHEHLVVHRDIKPGNMLVASDGTLKLLDFGIARLTDNSELALTETGLAPMTAAYASPEQRAGRTVTTATDIWSLGVVLYEVLTGERPRISAAEAGPLPPPSQQLSQQARTHDGSAADLLAIKRRGQALRGELDAIVMMCLRPEPDRRYASAAELGRDLQRWLDGRTVLARPDTLRYRTTMFVRRNRLATAALAAAVVALVAGTGISLRQADIARTERDRARREQVRTQRVAAFFQQVLTQAAPRAGGRALTVSEALTRAIPIIDTAFAGEPDIKAAVQLSVGGTLQNLEQHEQARALLLAAYDYFRTHDGAVVSRDQTDAIWNLASLAQRDGRLAAAESLYQRLAAVYHQPGYAPNDAVLAGLRIAGIRVDVGDLPAAVAAYDSLIPLLQMRTREDSIDMAANIGSRGSALSALGRFDRAQSDLARSLAINEAVLGRNSFATGQVLQPYAATMLFTGNLTEAESLARRAVDMARRDFGDDEPASLSAARMLGTVLVSRNRCTDAVAVFNGVLAYRGRTLADTDPTVGYTLAHRGYCRAVTGDAPGGIADAREGLQLSRAAVGERHYAYHLAQSLTGAALSRGGRRWQREADQLLDAGLTGLRLTLAPNHLRIREAAARLDEHRKRMSAIN